MAEQGRAPDRGVSEVLSYALIFAMIVSAISIVTVGGMSSLSDIRTGEQVNNAERAYDVLADNMADVHSEGVPSRATEISLGESELFFGDNVTMEVQVDEIGVASGLFTHSFELRPIVFRIDTGRRLVYEAGAVIREDREGGLVLSEPPFAMAEESVHIPIVRTTSPTVRSVGSANVLVRGKSTNRSILRSTVTERWELEHVQLTTPRASIWKAYFEDQPYCNTVTEPAPDTVRCEVDGSAFDDPDRLYLTLQQIEITLIT